MNPINIVFPGGKFKALTFSYDDGVTSDHRLVELFNRYNLKGTFHINAGLLGQDGKLSAQQIAQTYKGHEVAAHTYSHPTLTRLPRELMIEEIIEDRKGLEKYVNYPVRGFSYPNGAYNKMLVELLPMLGLEYARVVRSTGQFYMPDNWYEWQPTCHHNEQLIEHGQQFITLQKSQYLYLMYVWGHSYEFDRDENWEVMSQFCEYMAEQNDIWFATNIEIRDYIKRFEGLQFTADGSKVFNPFAQSVWLRKEDKIVEAISGVTTTIA